MMRDYSYDYEWDQEYCYESINRMFERIMTPISEEEQKENIRFFLETGESRLYGCGKQTRDVSKLAKDYLTFFCFFEP